MRKAGNVIEPETYEPGNVTNRETYEAGNHKPGNAHSRKTKGKMQRRLNLVKTIAKQTSFPSS